MSDLDIMAAIIERHVRARDPGLPPVAYRPTQESATCAARALQNAGFRMVADSDTADRLRALESRLDRIEGYMVIR